jgi:hypothetical protein
MSGKPAIGRYLATGPAVVITRPRPRTVQKANERYSALGITAGFFVLATLGFLSARAINHPTPSQPMSAELSAELYTGTIISNPYYKRECREQFFDNRTGKMTKPEPCGWRALSGDGSAARSNVMGPRDAIKKAFSNR